MDDKEHQATDEVLEGAILEQPAIRLKAKTPFTTHEGVSYEPGQTVAVIFSLSDYGSVQSAISNHRVEAEIANYRIQDETLVFESDDDDLDEPQDQPEVVETEGEDVDPEAATVDLDDETETEDEPDDLDTMDKDELEAWAREHLDGFEVDKRYSEENIRQKIRAHIASLEDGEPEHSGGFDEMSIDDLRDYAMEELGADFTEMTDRQALIAAIEDEQKRQAES